MKRLALLGSLLVLTSLACGPSAPPPADPSSAPPPAPAPVPSPAPAPPPAASAPPPAPAAAPVAIPDVSTDRVTAVSNEVSPPSVITPDKVIAGLRPKFNACFADGLKKDPKTAGAVTLSAKIEKDGKVSAVTPKQLTGFSPAVVKCLSDHLKGASFAAAGGMSYATSLDIPLSFTANP